jgi:hypothetical protein
MLVPADVNPQVSCGASFATYVLAHPQTPGTFTAVAADNGDAVSYRLTNGADGPAIQWMSTSAVPWAHTATDASGRVVTSPAASDPGVTPDVSSSFIRCFEYCIGACVSGGCLASCFTCATSFGFLGCLQCAGCAGPNALSCARICG